MKIACISDLHNKYVEWENKLIQDKFGEDIFDEWYSCDTVIFAGDATSTGTKYEIDKFLSWFSDLHFKNKIMIAGNHDFEFEYINNSIKIPDNVIYLDDSGVNIDNINIWGSPVQPEFNNWAFNRDRGNSIRKHWNLIPNNTDILIVHGPPLGYGDLLHPQFRRFNENFNVGCEDLRNRILEINSKFVICGHIHEGYGAYRLNDTEIINASCLDHNYRAVNAPIFIEI